MNDDEIPPFVIRGVAPQDDLSGQDQWVPEGEPVDDDADTGNGGGDDPVGEDVGGDRPD